MPETKKSSQNPSSAGFTLTQPARSGASHFHNPSFDVKAESRPDETRVVKNEARFTSSVQEFEFSNLHEEARRGYGALKSRFGALAATDADHAAKGRKDRRFSLNELARGPLSVEEEERRVIEERVATRIAALQDEVRQAGFQAGYADGLKEGHDEAFKNFREEAAPRLHALDSLVQAIEAAKADIFRANERYLIELIFRVSRMVMLKELSADPQYLLRLTRELVERVGVRENVTLRIHPKDQETIGMIKEGLERAFGGLKNLNIETSNQVSAGGCQLETEWNAIDASIDTQLKGVFEALVGQEAAASKGDPSGAAGQTA